MKKLYFAKSNRALPTTVELVRKHLQNFDYEVLQYEGEKPYPKPNLKLLSCDVMLVLPEHLDYHLVGKGLAGEIEEFKTKRKKGENTYNIYIIKTVTEEGILVDSLISTKEVAPTNWMNNTAVFTAKDPELLEHFITLKKADPRDNPLTDDDQYIHDTEMESR